MQRLTFSSAQSLPLLKPQRAASSSNPWFFPVPWFVPIRLSSFPSSPKPHDLNHVAISASLPRRTWSLSLSSSSPFKLRPSTSLSSLSSGGEANHFEFRAASVRGSAGESKTGFNSLMKTVEVCSAFGFGYLFDIFFNKYKKQIFKLYQAPVTHTTVQVVVGAVIVLFMWGFNIYKRLKISRSQELLQRQIALLNAIENKVSMKLHKEDIEELMKEIKRLNMEVQTCHNKAKYNKLVFTLLKSTLEQVMAVVAMLGEEACGDSKVGDAASYTKKPTKCRACKVSEVSFLLLPCRHFCLHKDYEGDCCCTS